MKILGIETSCDETAVCLIEAAGDFGNDFRFEILGDALYSQVATHAPYGGVFPNLAKREHARNLVPIMAQALDAQLENGSIELSVDDAANMRTILEREPELFGQLKAFLENHAKPDIDCIAVTHGPGLEPALWVGVNFAKALSLAWDVPAVAVNHMEGHVVMSMADDAGMKPFEFPLLSLLISGGHTELVLSKEWMSYEIVGVTRDDAVGEAFDKVARLLGLPYPGGPEISKLAAQARESGIESSIQLPRPMMHESNFDFSFSGLKTAVRRVVEAEGELSREKKLMIAREFEDAVTDVLVRKTLKACEEHGVRTILVGGGVSANSFIRTQLAEAIEREQSGIQLLVPPPKYATDNGLMIALAGYFHAQKGEFSDAETLRADGNLKLH